MHQILAFLFIYILNYDFNWQTFLLYINTIVFHILLCSKHIKPEILNMSAYQICINKSK